MLIHKEIFGDTIYYFYLYHIIFNIYRLMNTMTLNIDIPTDVTVDLKKLTAMATNYVQHYVYMMRNLQHSNESVKKSTASFRSMRGMMVSDKSYKEMIDDALTEKYKI